jgi:hypothetical protein
MPFWFVVGIAIEFEPVGRGTAIHVLQHPFASFEEAAQHLAEAETPVVAVRVTEAHAYVVEAATIDEAAALARAARKEPGTSPAVRVVQRDIRTRQAPAEPPEIEAVNRVHGELCITHQLAELALSRAVSNDLRERLQQHKTALEDLGYAVRVLRGNDIPEGVVLQSGSERLGYRDGQIGGADSATFSSALVSLACELSIARHQAEEAFRLHSPDHEATLRDLSAALDRFERTIIKMRQEAGSPA